MTAIADTPRARAPHRRAQGPRTAGSGGVMRLIFLFASLTLATNAIAPGALSAPISAYVKGEREKLVAMNDLADCFLRTERRKIIPALAADPTTAAYEKWADGHSFHCYLDVMKKHDVRIRPEGSALQYALAEAIFRRNFRSTSLTNLQLVPALPQGLAGYRWRYSDPQNATEQEAERQNDRRALYLSVLGECIVRADANGSHRLLSTQAWAVEEDRAFEALTPSISSCVDESQKISLDRQNLRGALALNYLRLERALSRLSPPNPGARR